MIPLADRCEILVKLGENINRFLGKYPEIDEGWEGLNFLAKEQQLYNPWFIEAFVLKALGQWAEKLSRESLRETLEKYPYLTKVRQPRHVAVIPEENVPLAGFHDLICVLLTGNHFYCRNLNHEHDLLKFLTDRLVDIDSGFSENIHWCQKFPEEVDTYLVFAKSGNSMTLKSYFEKKHSMIRQKRISIGILDTSGSSADFKLFATDIFSFFGLTSQSIRKIYIPKGFSLPSFFEAIEEYSHLYQFNRYANNYDYHKSVFMMDRIPFYDNGFFILRESSELKVPLGCLYYQYYQSIEELQDHLKSADISIQSIVTAMSGFPKSIKPGCSHDYPLWEFPDHKDTIQFLLS